MVFSSLTFISYFLPIFLLFYLLFKKQRNIILLIGSLIFYSFGEPIYIILLLFSSTVDFMVSKKIAATSVMKDRKKFLLISIALNVLVLTFFKYSDFLIQVVNDISNLKLNYLNLALPIGISFYTFQTMSYTIDVYRKKVSASNNYLNYLMYVSMFPQLIAGPIVRYSDIESSIINRDVKIDNLYEGFRRFIIGLAKKLLLGDALKVVYLSLLNTSGLGSFIAMLAYGMHIYYDFSGYSDMAIGLGKMLGFNFLENFDHPYLSSSVSEFFRRWHISLGTWFRDYIYFPMGGSRVNKKRLVINLFVVWLITGLWHGASYNFVLWGLYFCFFIVLEKLFLREFLNKHLIFSHFYLLIVVALGWVLFSSADLNQALLTYQSIFSFTVSMDTIYYLKNYFMIMLISIIALFKYKRINKNVEAVLLLGLFILCFMNMNGNSISPFIYFRF